MFPIRDRRGRVIAFGGRVLGDDTPKYLNSPETPLFHKGRELYGLFEARQASRHIERLIVVEGYMDVVALAQHGIRNAVATLGTAITSDHITPLFRTAPEVVFCFDGDRAGRDAAWKALDIVLPEIKEERSARFMFLPDGEDPDTMVRKIGQAGFEEEISKAMPLANFLLNNLLQRVDMNAIDGKARLVELTQPKLAKITNVLSRRRIISRLAQQIAMDDIELMHLLGEKPIENQRSKASQNRNSSEIRGLSPVRTVISLLLDQPQLAQKADEPARYLKLVEPGVTLMVELLELLQNSPNINCGTILEHWRERPEQKHLAKLAQLPLTTPTEGMEAEFLGALTLLDKQRIEREYAFLLSKSETQGLSQEEKRQLTQLQTEKRDLAKQLGRREPGQDSGQTPQL
jgi:DNA primase